jgi:hypothetical protein
MTRQLAANLVSLSSFGGRNFTSAGAVALCAVALCAVALCVQTPFFLVLK